MGEGEATRKGREEGKSGGEGGRAGGEPGRSACAGGATEPGNPKKTLAFRSLPSRPNKTSLLFPALREGFVEPHPQGESEEANRTYRHVFLCDSYTGCAGARKKPT